MSFEVRRLSGSLGAEVRGVALAEVDAAAAEEIRRLLLEHMVLFFPEQHLTPDEHIAFGRHFGELESHPNLDLRRERPEFFELRAVDGGGGIADGESHARSLGTGTGALPAYFARGHGHPHRPRDHRDRDQPDRRRHQGMQQVENAGGAVRRDGR